MQVAFRVQCAILSCARYLLHRFRILGVYRWKACESSTLKRKSISDRRSATSRKTSARNWRFTTIIRSESSTRHSRGKTGYHILDFYSFEILKLLMHSPSEKEGEKVKLVFVCVLVFVVVILPIVEF